MDVWIVSTRNTVSNKNCIDIKTNVDTKPFPRNWNWLFLFFPIKNPLKSGMRQHDYYHSFLHLKGLVLIIDLLSIFLAQGEVCDSDLAG
jgi:hypothetical protein